MSSDITRSFEPKSSNVIKVWYNTATEVLTVQFKGGKYRYYGVSESVYNNAKDSESVGKFLNGNVIGIYPTERID